MIIGTGQEAEQHASSGSNAVSVSVGGALSLKTTSSSRLQALAAALTKTVSDPVSMIAHAKAMLEEV